MTFDEALGELGVSRDAAGDDMRRAYLRLLKTRKPEVDPEGFRRLREAYELCRARGMLRPVRVEPEVPRAEVRAAEAVETSPVEMPPTATPPAETQSAEPPPMASSATAEEVSPAPARELSPAPAREPEPELPSFAEIAGLLREGKPRAAAKRLRVRLEAARQSAEAEPPPPPVVLETILLLQEKDEMRAADALAAAFRRWVGGAGEARVLTPQLAARWKLIEELAGLGTLNERIRTIIARALRTGQTHEALDELEKMSVLHTETAHAAASILRLRAPTLASTFAEPLHPSPKAVSARKSSIPWVYVTRGTLCPTPPRWRGRTRCSSSCRAAIARCCHWP